MELLYRFCQELPIEMLHWNFMKNALLALLIMAPLFGLLSTMIVTGRMSFFSDALGHSAFTGIAIKNRHTASTHPIRFIHDPSRSNVVQPMRSGIMICTKSSHGTNAHGCALLC